MFTIIPSLRRLLEVLVSLMVQERADRSREDLWWDGDNSVVEEVFKERSKRARDDDAEDELDTRDDNHTQEPHVHVEATPPPPLPPPPPPPPKRVVPFSFDDLVIVDPRGRRNYTLPSTDTVWYEKVHDEEGKLLDTWPPSSSTSPPSLVSDDGSTGSSERDSRGDSRGTVVNIVLTEYISSGASYDAYRGIAKVRYQDTSVNIPIVAKYLDAEAKLKRVDWWTEPDDYRVINYHTEVGVLQSLRRFDVVPLFYGKFENDQRDAFYTVFSSTHRRLSHVK